MTGERSKTPGVFVDRDGTLIREVGYLRRMAQIEVLPRVPEALQLLRRHGLKVVVLTNQSAVARGFITEQQLQGIHEQLKRQLAGCGAFVDGIYYCPHHPTEGMDAYRVSCDCRKPNVGLVQRAAEEFNLECARSYMVGDQSSDMELAFRIGAKGILIRAGAEMSEDLGSVILAVKDLWEAAEWIVQDLHGAK